MVSVVIPTYNRADLLPDAVRSCLQQTYENVEVIIVDDGSTDDTEAVVRTLMKSEWSRKRVSFWRIANQGPSAARQFGQDKAAGEFVQFLDSDDVLMPRKFELQVEAMQGGWSTAQACSCLGRKGPVDQGWGAGREIGARAQDVQGFVRELCSPSNFAMALGNLLWRARFLRERPGWPLHLRWSEDWYYCTSLAVGMTRMVFVEEELFWLRDHGGSRLTNAELGTATLAAALAFSSSLKQVTSMVRASPYFDESCREGLLKISRLAYLLLLESGAVEDITKFERFVGELAVGSRAAPLWRALIATRHAFGSNATARVARGLVRLKAAFR